MKISLNWLKDYIEFDRKLSIDDIAWKLTEATAEIEAVTHLGDNLETVIVGELLGMKEHPETKKLFIGKVKIGKEEIIQVVYGDKAIVNVGDKLPTALPGTVLHGGIVKESKIRGVASDGMFCLDSELFEDASPALTKFPKSTEVGKRIIDIFPIKDTIFEIDNHSITHRPDLFSHYGFARECVALGLAKWKKKLSDDDPKSITGTKKIPIDISFKDKRCSKNYYSTIIEGVSTKESPDWVKARLLAVGLRPINAIVDITNIVMLDVGQPNHAFDLRLVSGKNFTHRLSKKGESVTTLDGIKRELQDDIIVVESDKEIIDLCGVMGGENSAIKEDTSAIYFHSCHYDNVLVRRAMVLLGHRTDAGTIFEKNIEPERARQGFVRAMELFREIFPEAHMDYETFHYQNKSSDKIDIILPLEKIKLLLGVEIPVSKSKKYLEDLGFIVKEKESKFEIKVPEWRANGITMSQDLIEEIVRIHGYSKVPATPPVVELSTPTRNNKRHYRRTIQEFLIGQGFQEEVNFSFISEELLEKMTVPINTELIEIVNPVSEDFRFMKPCFLPHILNNLARNQVLETKEWRSFEMGSVYSRAEESVIEDRMLTFVVSPRREEDIFYDLKEIQKVMLNKLGLSVSYKEGEHDFSFPSRCMTIYTNKEAIGFIYELHPFILERFKIKGSVGVVEINLDRIYEKETKNIVYSPINRNPKAFLDINVIVHAEKDMKEVEDVIRASEPNFLKELKLIDVYEGENLGKSKKSFTFSITYQHPEKTLDEMEIQGILEKLIIDLEKSGGIVRR